MIAVRVFVITADSDFPLQGMNGCLSLSLPLQDRKYERIRLQIRWMSFLAAFSAPVDRR